MSKDSELFIEGIEDPEVRAKFLAAMKTAEWNMHRHEASTLLWNLSQEIQKTGGDRQRGEGIQLIERVRLRLKKWVE